MTTCLPPKRLRYALALIVLAFGCTLFWGAGVYLCRLAYGLSPVFRTGSVCSAGIRTAAPFIGWAGIGLSIGLAVRLITQRLSGAGIAALALIWAGSGFIWWEVWIQALRVLFGGIAVVPIGSLLAAAATALLVHVSVGPLSPWRMVVMLSGWGLARFSAGLYFPVTVILYRYPLEEHFYGLAFGLIGGLAMLIALHNLPVRDSIPTPVMSLVHNPRITRLAHTIPSPPLRFVLGFALLSTLLGAVMGAIVYLGQPPLAYYFRTNMRNTWAPEQTIVYFLLVMCIPLSINVALLAHRFLGEQVRQVLLLTNISIQDEVIGYTVGGLRLSLMLLSFLPGLAILGEAIMMIGAAALNMGTPVGRTEQLRIATAMQLQASVIVVLLQILGIYTFTALTLRYGKSTGILAALALVVGAGLMAALLIAGSRGEPYLSPFQRESLTLMPTMIIVLLLLFLGFLHTMSGQITQQ